MKTDAQLAMAVYEAVLSLNEAVAEANKAGLAIKLDHIDVPDCDRPDYPPIRFTSADVSRPLRAA